MSFPQFLTLIDQHYVSDKDEINSYNYQNYMKHLIKYIYLYSIVMLFVSVIHFSKHQYVYIYGDTTSKEIS